MYVKSGAVSMMGWLLYQKNYIHMDEVFLYRFSRSEQCLEFMVPLDYHLWVFDASQICLLNCYLIWYQGVDYFGNRIGFLKFRADIIDNEMGKKVSVSNIIYNNPL